MPKIKIAALAVGLSLYTMMTPTHASLDGALDGMLINVTDPVAYQSQTRRGFVGGNVAMRSPIRNVNIVSFDPPRMSAGCGGIDLFAGSFSFIDSDQLIAVFRSIAQNALGLIFMRALAAIDPKLQSLVSTIQSKLQSLNQLSSNTCAIAKQAVDTVFNSVERASTSAESGAAFFEAIAGGVGDLFESQEAVKASPKAKIKQACEAGSIEFCGNVVWDLMADNRVGELLGGGYFAGLSTKYAAELVMTMTGTAIYDPESAPSASETPRMAQRPGKIDLHDLKTGRSSGAQKIKYSCSSAPARGGCRSMDEVAWDWEGTVGYTNRMLFGSIDGTSTTADSIVGKMSPACAVDCTLSATQQSFVNATSVPFISMMLEVQSQEGAASAVAAQAAPLIAEELHIVLSEAVLRAARQVLSTKGSTTIPPEIHDRVRELGNQYSRIVTNRKANAQEFVALDEYVRTISRRDPSILTFTTPR